MNNKFTVLPDQNRVSIPTDNSQWLPLSEFPGVTGNNIWHDADGTSHHRTPFFHILKRAGYYKSRRDPSKDKDPIQGLGIKSQKKVAEVLFPEVKKTTQKNFRHKGIFGEVDGLTEEAVLEVKCKHFFANLTNEELYQAWDSWRVDGTAFFQALLPAYVWNKPYFHLIYCFPTEEDYLRQYVADPAARSLVKSFETKRYRKHVEEALKRYFDVMRDFRRGLSPEYDPNDPGDMYLVNEILSNTTNGIITQ